MIRRRAFTLVEMLVAVGILSITVGVAVTTFTKVRVREDSRAATRRLLGIAQVARTAALSLGVAARTTRARLDASCQGGMQIAFSNNNSATQGVAGLVFMRGVTTMCSSVQRTACCPPTMSAPCDLVSYVSDVRRENSTAVPWQGDNYTLLCKSEVLSRAGELRLGTRPFTGFQSASIGGASSFYIRYDNRGFVLGAGAAAFRIPVIAANLDLVEQNVLILGSGYACSEGAPAGQCQRRN